MESTSGHDPHHTKTHAETESTGGHDPRTTTMNAEIEHTGGDDTQDTKTSAYFRQEILDYFTKAAREGRVVPKIVTPDFIQAQRSQKVDSIFESYHLLGAVLDRHESTIRRRWLKKTKEQRRKVLLEAWGSDMAVCHRPDVEVMWELIGEPETHAYVRTSGHVRDAFLWPYINQTDLTQPQTMLLFLTARGRHHPAEFAAADLNAVNNGLESKVLVPDLLMEYVMMFSGRTEKARYGELIHWDEHPDALDWFTSGKGSQPGHGILILEAQCRTMSFLVSFAKRILHDLSAESLPQGPKQAPSLPEPGPGVSFASLASMAAEAPYRQPAELDFDRIAQLIAARRDEAVDHLLLLREDPGYFESCVTEWSEHRPEQICGVLGRSGRLVRTEQEVVFWGRVLLNDISYAYIQIEIWSELQNQAQSLRDMQKLHAVRPEDDLPTPYMDAILRFREYLSREAFRIPCRFLKTCIYSSPPVREYYEATYRSEDGERSTISRKSDVHFDEAQCRLETIIQVLADEKNRATKLAVLDSVEQLQILVDIEPSVKAMITRYVASHVGDLAIICQCSNQMNTYQPWASAYDHFQQGREEAFKAEFIKTSERWMCMLDAIEHDPSTLARLGTPTDGRFSYPVEKRRTKEIVETMRKAESHLDAFWQNIDSLMEKFGGNSAGTVVHQLLMRPRTLQRTPAWEEPQKKQALQRAKETIVPFAELDLDRQLRTEQTISNQSLASRRKAKTKTKTRGVTDPGDRDTVENVAPELESEDRQLVFAVDARALRVFKTLFFTPSITATPGDIAWADFLHAMASTGFAPQKLYGSVWHFSPVT